MAQERGCPLRRFLSLHPISLAANSSTVNRMLRRTFRTHLRQPGPKLLCVNDSVHTKVILS